MATLVDVDALTRHFGAVMAVDRISFSVHRGEVLGFLGPNGAGKSTSMKMIAAILSPTAGTAVVAGADVRENPVAVKHKLGYLPEGSPLYGDMTPEGLLDFVARVRLLPAPRRRRAVAEAIERLSLGEVLHRRIETLSNGFRRRVGIAQAILHDPEVLILDEPTDGLDPNQKHEVRELIRAMGKTKAIIISTHILEEVDAICDRAIIIDRGRIVLDATPSELHARSPHYNTVALTVAGADARGAISALQALTEVAAVEQAGVMNGSVRLLARPRGGRFIAEVVTRTMQMKGLRVTELSATTGSLDEVFRSMTTGSRDRGRV
jgi:ABC-2 type transport system ATP-binding protein